MMPALVSEPEATALLERSINYARTMVRGITAHELPRPTPCRNWNLHMLMLHLNESMTALREGIDTGSVSLHDERAAPPVDPAIGLAAAFRYQAGGLLGSCANGTGGRTEIGERSLPTAIVAATGALEIAVHGWDVGTAREQRSPIPDRLAGTLLDLATLLVPSDNRGSLFAAPIPPPPRAGAGARLVAFLGRG